MVFRLFTKAKRTPLTAYCTQLSTDKTLLNAAGAVVTDPSVRTDKRAVVLCLFIMAAAGNFVGDFQEKDQAFYEDMRKYFGNTNLDVVTAETIIWITFLMGWFWKADQKKDHEMFERVGYVTVSTAGRLCLEMIETKTGVDFTARAIESRELYFKSMKDGSLVEAFASVLLRSVGCKSVAEPLKTIRVFPFEGTPIFIAVTIFFSSMPLAFYDTFKNMLRDRSDLFPHDDDLDD